jgi:hypothetical protein
MDFERSKQLGKETEQFAKEYFERKRYHYIDVTENSIYQKDDIDFIVEELGTVETKLNLHKAVLGKSGLFFWVELSVGNHPGWFYYSKADYFLFFNGEGSYGVLIKNDKGFKDKINNYIENYRHNSNGYFRFDYKKDGRNNYRGFITSTCMRVYLEKLEEVKDFKWIEK